MRITLKAGVLARYMTSKKIDGNELAKRIGVDKTTLWRVEQGLVDPSPKFIAGLMAESGKRFESLFELVKAAA
jgi:transcriptional regulator with XRE-family HTH domain